MNIDRYDISRFILGSILAITLINSGISVFTWQFWIIISIAIGFGVTGYIKGLNN